MLKAMDEWLYHFLEERVAEMPMRFVKMIAYHYTDARIRKLYWKRLGVEMGEGTFSGLGMIVVPNNNSVCVEIGKNVSIAPYVTFVCSEAANNGKEINALSYVKNKLTRDGNIIIEDEVWLGANVTILSDIKIGRCTVIGAGSVVIENCEPYSVYAGVPAKKIRSLH